MCDGLGVLCVQEGRTHGDCLSVQETLSQLTQTHYPLEELKADPLPEGVDPQRLESYLADEEFEVGVPSFAAEVNVWCAAFFREQWLEDYFFSLESRVPS